MLLYVLGTSKVSYPNTDIFATNDGEFRSYTIASNAFFSMMVLLTNAMAVGDWNDKHKQMRKLEEEKKTNLLTWCGNRRH